MREICNYFVVFGILLRTAYSQPCPNSCNLQGRCLDVGRVCECYEGFRGGDCSEMWCPFSSAWVDLAQGIDNAHNSAECSNKGTCDRASGLCTCEEGFTGKACDRKVCPGNCNGHGKCLSMAELALSKDPGYGTVYPYEEPWDAHMMYGCLCDDEYYGASCSLRKCPTGDDPMTGVGLSTTTNPTQSNEVQRVACKAGEGSFTLTYLGKTTDAIPYNSKASQIQGYIEALTNIKSGGVKIVMFGSQACIDSGTAFTVQFLQNFGPLPLMIPNGAGLGFPDPTNVASILVTHEVVGSKENLECSNRGTCDSSTGYCSCSSNFDTSNGYNAEGTRGDCGNALLTIQACPGLTSCSSHGLCSGDPKFTCSCSAGWTGADCSEKTCVGNLDWFGLPDSTDVAHTESVECGGAGDCDRTTGICACEVGFEGASCALMSCPGAVLECNGNGVCESMETLATRSTINGDNAGFTYGATPGNPLTWDAQKIYGCTCNDGYTGYSCNEMVCPYGDDPLTVDQEDEVQLLKCTDADMTGSLVFTFREQTSAYPIGVASSMATVQAALETVTGIGVIDVQLLNADDVDNLCSTTGSEVLLTFYTSYGDIPLLRFTNQLVDSFVVEEYIKGTKENIECSGRGLCAPATGECTCFTGFDSSDGQGGIGTTGDCSYINPITLILS